MIICFEGGRQREGQKYNEEVVFFNEIFQIGLKFTQVNLLMSVKFFGQGVKAQGSSYDFLAGLQSAVL